MQTLVIQECGVTRGLDALFSSHNRLWHHTPLHEMECDTCHIRCRLKSHSWITAVNALKILLQKKKHILWRLHFLCRNFTVVYAHGWLSNRKLLTLRFPISYRLLQIIFHYYYLLFYWLFLPYLYRYLLRLASKKWNPQFWIYTRKYRWPLTDVIDFTRWFRWCRLALLRWSRCRDAHDPNCSIKIVLIVSIAATNFDKLRYLSLFMAFQVRFCRNIEAKNYF